MYKHHGIENVLEKALNLSTKIFKIIRNMFIGYVYKVDCLKSSKSYIGITTTTLEFRKKTHIQSAFNENHGRYNIHFYKALRKYDLNLFQ
jgi:hypothetical protein